MRRAASPHALGLFMGLALIGLNACSNSSDSAVRADPADDATPSTSPAPSSSPDSSAAPNATPAPDAGDSEGEGEGEGDSSPRDFGQANDNQIRPGIQVSSADGSCTSNFIYHDAQGHLYIGAAAHCFSPDTNSGIDACDAQNQLMGSPVQLENASTPGQLFYSSWQAMKDNAESAGSGICQGNDFALVRIDPADQDNVHPSALVYGGPSAMLQQDAQIGDEVYSFGQSPFHLGVGSLQRKQGQITAQSADGWTYSMQTDNPGLSGDSGSAVLHESGQALGVLVTVGVGFPGPVSNGVCNLDLALAYANDYLGMNLQLTTADTFSP